MLDSIFYLLIFAVVFVLQTFAMRLKDYRTKKWIIIFSFIILLCLIGFRYQVGTDYDSYVAMYGRYANSALSEVWMGKGDIGTKIIFGFMPYVFSDAKIIFWIYGFFALYPIYKINKNSDFKYLAYSTLVFNLVVLPICLNGIRQGAAMSFALLAFDYLLKDPKKLKSMLCMIVAIMLHTSAILMLPFILARMYAKKHNKRFSLFVIAITGFIAIALTTFLRDMFIENEFYSNILAYSSGGLGPGWFTINISYYFVLLILVVVMYKRNKKDYLEEDDIVKDTFCMVLAGAFLRVVSASAIYLYRIEWYFTIYQVILIPVILQNIVNKNTRLMAKILCIGVLVFLFVLNYSIRGQHEIVPYKTWLFLG